MRERSEESSSAVRRSWKCAKPLLFGSALVQARQALRKARCALLSWSEAGMAGLSSRCALGGHGVACGNRARRKAAAL